MNKMYATVTNYDNNYTVINERGVKERKVLYELSDIVLIKRNGGTFNWIGKVYISHFDNSSFNTGGRYQFEFYKIKNLNVFHTEWINGGDPEILETQLNIHYLDYYKVLERHHTNTEEMKDEWLEDYGDEIEEPVKQQNMFDNNKEEVINNKSDLDYYESMTKGDKLNIKKKSTYHSKYRKQLENLNDFL